MAVGDPFFQLLKHLNFWKIFMGYEVLGWQVFFLLCVKDVDALILDCIVSNRKSAAVLISAPLCVLRPLLRFFLIIVFKQFDYDKLGYNFIYLFFLLSWSCRFVVFQVWKSFGHYFFLFRDSTSTWISLLEIVAQMLMFLEFCFLSVFLCFSLVKFFCVFKFTDLFFCSV